MAMVRTTRADFSLALFWAHIGLAGSFGTLFGGWLVDVARRMYLAGHLFTLCVFRKVCKERYQSHNFPSNSNAITVIDP